MAARDGYSGEYENAFGDISEVASTLLYEGNKKIVAGHRPPLVAVPKQ